MGLSGDLERARAACERATSAIVALTASRERLSEPQRRVDGLKAELAALNEQHAAELREWVATGCDGGRPELPERVEQIERELWRLARSVAAAGNGLAEIDERLSRLQVEAAGAQREYESVFWSSFPRAAAHLFEVAESAKKAFEVALTAIDSVATSAWEAAHVAQPNGSPPEQHPAFKAWQALGSAVQLLIASLGQRVSRDTETGPALVRALEAGEAELGDISRWLPPSQALPSGEGHLNLAPAENPLGSSQDAGTSFGSDSSSGSLPGISEPREAIVGGIPWVELSER